MTREAQGGRANVFQHHRLLRAGDHEYVLLELHEQLPEGHELVPLGDTWRAERRLRELAYDYLNLRTLRELARSHTLAHAFEPVSEDQLVRRLATLFVHGHLRLARSPLVMVPGVLPPREEKAAPESAPVEEKQRLMLQIVDDVSEDPFPDLTLRVKLPDGSEKKVKTDASGRIEIPNLLPGRITVSSVLDGAILGQTLVFVKAGILPSYQQEPSRQRRGADSELFLARVLEHKVSDGDTLESIAEAHELTVDQLTKFNWGTTEPDQIQRRLLIDVGCTVRDDSGKFVLTAQDNPGILYIPRPLVMDWMALEQRHIWRVKRVSKRRIYLLST
jgi:hypothetical protein